MSLTFRDAKAWAKQDSEHRDWRDVWKYGLIIRSVGLGVNTTFTWGPNVSAQQKDNIELFIFSPNKWAETVEAILDNPPSSSEKKLIKLFKKYKIKLK